MTFPIYQGAAGKRNNENQDPAFHELISQLLINNSNPTSVFSPTMIDENKKSTDSGLNTTTLSRCS